MKTIKVSEATERQLDWMVSTLTNPEWDYEDRAYNTFDWIDTGDTNDEQYSPSTDWAQGGPIIEREGINLSVDYQDSALSNDMVQIGWKGNLWNNSVPGTAGFLQWAYGPTPLIAAMRCFVISKLGDTVEVPEELT